MTTEWWYEDAIFDIDGDVVLARLRLRGDGTAQILTDGGETLEFASHEDASRWLTDEEYSRLETLHEILAERGEAIDPRIKPPCATRDGDLVKQMVIKLDRSVGSAKPV